MCILHWRDTFVNLLFHAVLCILPLHCFSQHGLEVMKMYSNLYKAVWVNVSKTNLTSEAIMCGASVLPWLSYFFQQGKNFSMSEISAAVSVVGTLQGRLYPDRVIHIPCLFTWQLMLQCVQSVSTIMTFRPTFFLSTLSGCCIMGVCMCCVLWLLTLWTVFSLFI